MGFSYLILSFPVQILWISLLILIPIMSSLLTTLKAGKNDAGLRPAYRTVVAQSAIQNKAFYNWFLELPLSTSF